VLRKKQKDVSLPGSNFMNLMWPKKNREWKEYLKNSNGFGFSMPKALFLCKKFTKNRDVMIKITQNLLVKGTVSRDRGQDDPMEM
jgi:hypothetical protein